MVNFEEIFSAAMASLTLTFCRGFGSDVNTDDLLFVSLKKLSPGIFPLLISETLLTVRC